MEVSGYGEKDFGNFSLELWFGLIFGFSLLAFASSGVSLSYTTYITVSWIGNYGEPLTYNFSTQYWADWSYYETINGNEFNSVTYYQVIGDLCGEPPVDSFAVEGNYNTLTDTSIDTYTIYQSQLTFQPTISNCPVWEGGYINIPVGQDILYAGSMSAQASVAWA